MPGTLLVSLLHYFIKISQSPSRKVSASPFCWWEKWDPETFRNLAKVTQLISGTNRFRTQVSVALKPVFFPLCPWWENNTSSNNSMAASLLVIWAGMSQVWWKHTWEDICNVWAPGRTLHSGWLWGWGLDLVLDLWATSDRNVTQTRSSRSDTYSMSRKGEQSMCGRRRCAAGP